MKLHFSEKDGAIFFTVRIAARASKSEIVGEMSGALKIRIASPPIDGAANAELIRVLAKKFDVSKSAVEIFNGQHSKTKKIKIYGLNAEKLIESVGV